MCVHLEILVPMSIGNYNLRYSHTGTFIFILFLGGRSGTNVFKFLI